MKTLSPSPDVLTSQASHPGLQPFIQKYAFRKILIPDGCSINKVMPLRSVSSLDFFLGDEFAISDIRTGRLLPFLRCTVRGPRTCILHAIRLKGTFISFTIRFKATGLYKLLGIPMDMFTNKAIPGDSIIPLPVEEITRQLLYAPDMACCIQMIEPYLLSLVGKGGNVPPAIEKAAKIIEERNEVHSISELADESYVSRRQLERHFIKYLGVCPKTYFRMHRFLRLLQAKEAAPELKWVTLAHQFGYYDQMHLVKEFKQFLKTTPSAFHAADFAF